MRSDVLNENSLWKDQKERDAYYSDPSRRQNAFWTTFLGILALKQSAPDNPVIDRYFRSDKSVRPTRIGDENNDFSLVVKLIADEDGVPQQVVNEITRFIALLKQGKIDRVNEDLLREIVKKLTAKRLLVKADPKVKQAVSDFAQGDTDLQSLLPVMIFVARKEKLSGEFLSLAKRVKPEAYDNAAKKDEDDNRDAAAAKTATDSGDDKKVAKQPEPPKGTITIAYAESKTREELVAELKKTKYPLPSDDAVIFIALVHEFLQMSEDDAKKVLRKFKVKIPEVKKALSYSSTPLVEAINRLSTVETGPGSFFRFLLNKFFGAKNFIFKTLLLKVGMRYLDITDPEIMGFLVEMFGKQEQMGYSSAKTNMKVIAEDMTTAIKKVGSLKEIVDALNEVMNRDLVKQELVRISGTRAVVNLIPDEWFANITPEVFTTLGNLMGSVSSPHFTSFVRRIAPIMTNEAKLAVAKLPIVAQSQFMLDYFGVKKSDFGDLYGDEKAVELMVDDVVKHGFKKISEYTDFIRKTYGNLSNALEKTGNLKRFVNRIVKAFYGVYTYEEFLTTDFNEPRRFISGWKPADLEKTGLYTVGEGSALDKMLLSIFPPYVYDIDNIKSVDVLKTILETGLSDSVKFTIFAEHVAAYRKLHERLGPSANVIERLIEKLIYRQKIDDSDYGVFFMYLDPPKNNIDVPKIALTGIPDMVKEGERVRIYSSMIGSFAAVKEELTDEEAAKLAELVDKNEMQITLSNVIINGRDKMGPVQTKNIVKVAETFLRDGSKDNVLQFAEHILFLVGGAEKRLSEDEDFDAAAKVSVRKNPPPAPFMRVIEQAVDVAKANFDPDDSNHSFELSRLILGMSVFDEEKAIEMLNGMLDKSPYSAMVQAPDLVKVAVKDPGAVNNLVETLGRVISLTGDNDFSTEYAKNMSDVLGSLYDAGYPEALDVFFDRVKGTKAERKIRYQFRQMTMFDAYAEKLTEDTSQPIRPLVKLSPENTRKLLRFNNFSVKGGPSKRQNKTWGKHISELRDYVKSLEMAPLRVSEIEETEEDIERKTAEFHQRFYSGGRHGDIAVKFLKSFDVVLVADEFLDFKSQYPDTVMRPVFHGTGSVSASMILRFGFRIVPAAFIKAGRMLGHGIYFSTVIDKVAQYVGDQGFTRWWGTKGYILEMEAVLGEEGTHYKQAGTTGSDGIISPEWCVFNPRAQLNIYRAHFVELVPRKVADELAAKYPLQESGTGEINWIDFLREESEMTNVAKFIFMDGNIPLADGTLVPFEKYPLKKNQQLGYSQHGPVLYIQNDLGDDSVTFVPFAAELVKNDPEGAWTRLKKMLRQ